MATLKEYKDNNKNKLDENKTSVMKMVSSAEEKVYDAMNDIRKALKMLKGQRGMKDKMMLLQKYNPQLDKVASGLEKCAKSMK